MELHFSQCNAISGRTQRVLVQLAAVERSCLVSNICVMEMFLPKVMNSYLSLPGGPSGGNGGNGGAVWAVADESLNSLTSFRKQLHYRAQPGTAGGGSNRHGSNGADLDIHVSSLLVSRPRYHTIRFSATRNAE